MTWQHTLQETAVLPALPARVFEWIDTPANTGLHMSRPSMAMLGGSLQVERLSPNAAGVGATYRSWGRVLGLRIDFTTRVTVWLPEREKSVETIGEPRLIVIGDFQMRSSITRLDSSTRLVLALAYNLPAGWFGRLLGRVLARPYVRWCPAPYRIRCTSSSRCTPACVRITAVRGRSLAWLPRLHCPKRGSR